MVPYCGQSAWVRDELEEARGSLFQVSSHTVPHSGESADQPGLHSGGAQGYSAALLRYTMENSTTVALTLVWPLVDPRMMEMMQDNRTHNYNHLLQFNIY